MVLVIATILCPLWVDSSHGRELTATFTSRFEMRGFSANIVRYRPKADIWFLPVSPHEIALTYLRPIRGLEEDPEIYGTVLEAVTCDFEKGIEITLALVAASNNAEELGYVAAGPVEDLLKWHGNRAIAALEAAAEGSEKVRDALAGVYLDQKHEAHAAWLRLLAKYGRR